MPIVDRRISSTALPRAFSIVILLFTLGILVASVPVTADVCEQSVRPAASLLFPYFEVDLADPAGRTTLISVNNAGQEATTARLTMWTNLGAPTLGFDLVLEAGDAQSINVRNLLSAEIPTTDSAEDLIDCSHPVETPVADSQLLADLRAWHTGTSDSSDLCRGEPTGEAEVAVGYITIDATNRCYPFDTFPGDFQSLGDFGKYFEDGGLGLASNDNVLWGDTVYIDPGGDAAQATGAVHIRADADSFEGFSRTFYGMGADDRAPLPSIYRARYLAGAPAATATSFLVWLDPYSLPINPSGTECEFPRLDPNPCHSMRTEAFDEAGLSAGEPMSDTNPPVVRRMTIGEHIETSAGSGQVSFFNEVLVACMLIPIGLEPVQSMVIPVFEAEGRFSAASAAVALYSTCGVN